ncbi:Piwi domain-containing protein [Hysterangium stoloniferum]|nr:Piwi domain-containing protein [Hysterangium stoloniferum]
MSSLLRRLLLTNAQEYFKRTYNYSVKYGRLINVKLSNTRDVVVPIEVLDVKPGQFYKKRLSAAETAQVIQFSTQKPIGSVPMVIPGRTLPALKIRYGNNFEESPTNGAWNDINRKLVEPRDVISWAVMVFDREASPNEIESFVLDLHRAYMALGITAVYPGQAAELPLEKQLENAYRLAGETYTEKATFILVILPDFSPEVITAVKYWRDCRQGCPTQCVKRGEIRRANNPNNQYCNNVALKNNARIGGVNWYPSESLQAMKYLKESPTMVVGADVSHAGPDSDRPSVAGLVSSVDANMCRYVGSTSVQESRVEGIIGLDHQHAISMFNRSHQNVFKQSVNPQRIIFYRDGLSEGQFEVVAREEIKIIKKVFQKTKIDAEFVYIVVGKRHHIRFFPPSGTGDKSGNCESSLIKLSCILSNMISTRNRMQVSLEACSTVFQTLHFEIVLNLCIASRSVHYSVIADELNLPADGLQAITFVPCHHLRTRDAVGLHSSSNADLVCGRGTYHSLLLRGGEHEITAFAGEQPTLEDHRMVRELKRHKIIVFDPCHASGFPQDPSQDGDDNVLDINPFVGVREEASSNTASRARRRPSRYTY